MYIILWGLVLCKKVLINFLCQLFLGCPSLWSLQVENQDTSPFYTSFTPIPVIKTYSVQSLAFPLGDICRWLILFDDLSGRGANHTQNTRRFFKAAVTHFLPHSTLCRIIKQDAYLPLQRRFRLHVVWFPAGVTLLQEIGCGVAAKLTFTLWHPASRFPWRFLR